MGKAAKAESPSDRFLPWIVLLTAALFVPLFVFQKWGPLDFWWWITGNLVLLISIAVLCVPSFRRSLREDLRREILRKILIGILSAGILYAVFFAGNTFSKMILPFAQKEIPAIYGFKAGAAPRRIFLLMAFLIGPGEEIFWRGYLQRGFALKWGQTAGFLSATLLYAGVHIGSGNVMLILAALTCGLAWGWLYLRFQSVLLNIISHTLWDLTIFLIFPLY